FWAENGNLYSAMACCTGHDEPYQSLDKLFRTHDFKIEKKHNARLIPTVDEQFAELKEKFPSAVISEAGVDDERWLSFECPLRGWDKESTKVYFRIQTGYPFARPDGGGCDIVFRAEGVPRLAH